MIYQYRAINFAKFIRDNPGKLQMNWSSLIGFSEELVESCLNFYGAQGWEYVRVEEVDPGSLKMLGGLVPSLSGNWFMFIFRKEVEVSKEDQEKRDEELKDRLEEKERRARIPPGAAREPSENPNAKCPNCDAPINERDEDCWKCKASFSGSSAWKPIKK